MRLSLLLHIYFNRGFIDSDNKEKTLHCLYLNLSKYMYVNLMVYSYPNSISKVFFNFKKTVLLITILLFSSFVRGQFSLTSNNKTILCPNVVNGSTGTVNGKVYTKVDRSDLQTKIAEIQFH